MPDGLPLFSFFEGKLSKSMVRQYVTGSEHFGQGFPFSISRIADGGALHEADRLAIWNRMPVQLHFS